MFPCITTVHLAIGLIITVISSSWAETSLFESSNSGDGSLPCESSSFSGDGPPPYESPSFSGDGQPPYESSSFSGDGTLFESPSQSVDETPLDSSPYSGNGIPSTFPPDTNQADDSNDGSQSNQNPRENEPMKNQPSEACWRTIFQPVNNIQIGGNMPENATKLLNTLLNMTHTILNILQSQTHPDLNRPRDCSEILARGANKNGVYNIYIEGNEGPLPVYCDMETDGGGWTVFQRRQDGSVDFYLDWSHYKRGFGEAAAEHWLGNDNLHLLTSQRPYELRIDLEDFEGHTRYARYGLFNVGDRENNYRLTSGEYFGDAGDGLKKQAAGRPFSTKDRDNDEYSGSCAALFTGAWWYGLCHESNLNGQYLRGQNDQRARGVVWHPWLGHFYSLKKTEMKIRPL